MKPYLITVDSNWADEIDFCAQEVIITTEEEIKEIIKKAKTCEHGAYVGSNEEVPVRDCKISYHELNKEEHITLEKYLPSYPAGVSYSTICAYTSGAYD